MKTGDNSPVVFFLAIKAILLLILYRRMALNRVSDAKLYLLLLFIGFLNVFDLSATIYWHNTYGSFIEGNPLMKYLLEISPAVFASAKLGIMVLFFLLILIVRKRNYLLAGYGTIVVFAVYLLLAYWHIAFYYYMYYLF